MILLVYADGEALFLASLAISFVALAFVLKAHREKGNRP